MTNIIRILNATKSVWVQPFTDYLLQLPPNFTICARTSASEDILRGKKKKTSMPFAKPTCTSQLISATLRKLTNTPCMDVFFCKKFVPYLETFRKFFASIVESHLVIPCCIQGCQREKHNCHQLISELT